MPEPGQGEGQKAPGKRNFQRNVEKIGQKADTVLIKLQETAANVMYRSTVPKERQELALRQADLFLGEFTNYLKDGTAEKLAPIRPTGDQLEVLQFTFESIDAGTLTREDSQGKFGSTLYGASQHKGKPILASKYSASRNMLDRRSYRNASPEVLEQWRDFRQWGANKRLVGVHLDYVVEDNFPDTIRIVGFVGYKSPGLLSFLFLPQKAESAEQIVHQRSIPQEDHGWENTVGVYNDGKRVIFNTEGTEGKERFAYTSQYYLIGTFDGEETGRTYWVYGNNADVHDKESVTELATVKQPALVPVTKG